MQANAQFELDHLHKQDDLQIFRLIFQLFDTTETGYISLEELLLITEVYLKQDRDSMIQQLINVQQRGSKDSVDKSDESTDKVSFGEFVTVMWQLKEESKRPVHDSPYVDDIIDIKIGGGHDDLATMTQDTPNKKFIDHENPN